MTMPIGGNVLTRNEYLNLINNRPPKARPEEVDYRKGQGDEVCSGCVHFYVRQVDHFATCELIRDLQIDRVGIQPQFTCDWMSPDGESFPFQPMDSDERGDEDETPS
jgi:hypothetical protein